MANKHFMSNFFAVTGIDPVADCFDGTKSTDVINASNAHAVHFVVHQGVGATGTRTYTVEACDDTTPSNTTAVPFTYQQVLASGTTDVPAALVRATAAGYTSTAGSGQVHVISVDCDQLGNSERKFVRLTAVEVTNSPVLAGITVYLEVARPRNIHATAIA